MRMIRNQLPSRVYNKIRLWSQRKTRKRWIINIEDILNRWGYNATKAAHLAMVQKLKLSLLHLMAGVRTIFPVKFYSGRDVKQT